MNVFVNANHTTPAILSINKFHSYRISLIYVNISHINYKKTQKKNWRFCQKKKKHNSILRFLWHMYNRGLDGLEMRLVQEYTTFKKKNLLIWEQSDNNKLFSVSIGKKCDSSMNLVAVFFCNLVPAATKRFAMGCFWLQMVSQTIATNHPPTSFYNCRKE